MQNSRRAGLVITKARARLLSNHQFYGHIACSLVKHETDRIPTWATDGKNLFYNPSFTVTLTHGGQMTAMAHEVHHVVWEHFLRSESKVPEVWKIACEYPINAELSDAGFEPIPNWLLPPKEFWHDSAEQHYSRLLKEWEESPETFIVCGGSCSGVEQMEGLSPADRERIKGEVRARVMAAVEFSRHAGNLPGWVERLIGDIRAPKVSYNDVLRRFMTAPAKDGYRMTPPNRRYLSRGLYLPSLRSDTVANVLFILDGSGSTINVFHQFVCDLASCVTEVSPDVLHAMVWDTQCSWYQQFDHYSGMDTQDILAMEQHMGAGGGTNFKNCFDYFAEINDGTVPDIAIVLTDMEVFEWPDDPGYPVLWVATTDIQGPFGETIRISE